MAKLIIGSRGSQLALTQTRHMHDQLCAIHADLEVEIEIIRTTGDENRAPLRSFGGQGVFTKELENALLEGLCDVLRSSHATSISVAAGARQAWRSSAMPREGCAPPLPCKQRQCIADCRTMAVTSHASAKGATVRCQPSLMRTGTHPAATESYKRERYE